MQTMTTHGVGVTFTSIPVLEDVNLRLEAGWYGLVGANGGGKTTLLRVLAGELAPDEGRVVVSPRGARVVLCRQEEDGARFAGSPGERKRRAIEEALAQDPDVLLLDEPTNHLDAAGRATVLRALRRFRGIGVVVSHDRALLDALPGTILRVHHARVTAYAGGYERARETWTGERRAEEEAHEVARARLRAAEARLADARRDQDGAERSRSAGSRMKNVRDHDARGSLRKGMAAAAEAKAGRTVGVRRKEVERAARDVPFIAREHELGGAVFAAFERAPAPVLFQLDDERVTIRRDDRVRVAGPNGAGKTTLLRRLMDATPPARRDRVLYLPQELGHGASRELLGSLRAAPPDARGRVLSVLAALGLDPDRVVGRQDDLSPGEARKLALAIGLGRHAWALVLDEPENHLDLPSVERLERALVSYPGCLVIVTHDDRLAAATTVRALQLP